MTDEPFDQFVGLENVENVDIDNEVMLPFDQSLQDPDSELYFDANNQEIDPQITQEIDAKSCSDIEIPVLVSNSEILEDVIEKEKPRTYLELVELDDVNCVTNTEVFECPVCFLDIGVGEGIVLRDCLHTFCKYGI